MGEPIYIVSGFPRSGTSMMMRALEAGGLSCVYSTRGDADRNRNTLIPGYIPNPHGFYESDDLHNLTDWSPVRGKAIKVIRENLDLIPTGTPCCTVYMRRDPAEIRLSYYGILSGPHDESMYSFLDNYEADVAADVARLSGMGSVCLLEYSTVIADPLGQFSRLGWPIDSCKAAAIIDPSLYRHRRAA